MATRAIFALVVLFSYAASCILPATYGEGGHMESGTEIPGLTALLAIFAVFIGFNLDFSFVLAWLANPCLFLGFFFFAYKKDGLACLFAGVGFFLSLIPGIDYSLYSTARFQFEPVLALNIGTDDRRNELRIGYFVWSATHFLLFCAASISHFWDRDRLDQIEIDSPVK